MNPDNWGGLYYELCLELGPAANDNLLSDAVSALWSLSALDGPWRTRDSYRSTPESLPLVNLLACHYGVSNVDGTELGCVTHVVREEPGSDWLDLCFPAGMLHRAYGLKYPLDHATNPWLAVLDKFFTEAAVSIFRRAPFRLGVIGEETSGIVSAATLRTDSYERYRLIVPTALADDIGAPVRELLPYGLCVLPQRSAN